MRHRFTFNPHSAVSPREKDVVFRSLHVESSLLGGLHPTNSSKSVNQTAEYGIESIKTTNRWREKLILSVESKSYTIY